MLFSICYVIGWFCSLVLHFPPLLFQLTETICTGTNRFQSTGEKAGVYTGSFYIPCFLTKIPCVGWAHNQGYAFTWLLLYTPQRLSDPKTISEVPFWMGIESWENTQKTEFNWSVKKQEEICKSSNMLFIKLKWSCVCVYFLRSLRTSKSTFDLYDWIPPRLQKWRLMQILLI